MSRTAIAGLILLMAATIAGSAHATSYTLTDLNSTLVVDDQGQLPFNWVVDGTDHVYRQWWYYRIGAAPGTTQGIEALNLISATPTADRLDVTYGPSDNSFALRVSWTLFGGSANSGVSDLSEQVRLINRGNSALDFYLFEYNDFDLNDTSLDDGIKLGAACAVDQWDGGVHVRETVVKTPDFWEVGAQSTVFPALTSGNDLANAVPAAYNADLAWAFEWRLNLAPGMSDTFSKNKRISTVVPEWNSLFLAVVGMVGTIGIRRRRR